MREGRERKGVEERKGEERACDGMEWGGEGEGEEEGDLSLRHEGVL